MFDSSYSYLMCSAETQTPCAQTSPKVNYFNLLLTISSIFCVNENTSKTKQLQLKIFSTTRMFLEMQRSNVNPKQFFLKFNVCRWIKPVVVSGQEQCFLSQAS